MATFYVNMFGTINPSDNVSLPPPIEEFTLHVLQVECDDPSVNDTNFHMFIEFYAFPWTITANNTTNSTILLPPQLSSTVVDRIPNDKPQVIYINKLQPNVPVLLYDFGSTPTLPPYPIGADGSDFRLYSGIYRADIGNPNNTNIDTTGYYYTLPVKITIIANGCVYQSDANSKINIGNYISNRIIGGNESDGIPLGFFDKITISNNITQSNITFTNCTLTTAEIILDASNGTPPYNYFETNTLTPINNGDIFPLNSSIDITIIDANGCQFQDTVIASCNSGCDSYVFAPSIRFSESVGDVSLYNCFFNIYNNSGLSIPIFTFNVATLTINSISNGTVVLSDITPTPISLPQTRNLLIAGNDDIFVEYLTILNQTTTFNFTIYLETISGCIYSKNYSITVNNSSVNPYYNSGIYNL
jgi:hypothetical protein